MEALVLEKEKHIKDDVNVRVIIIISDLSELVDIFILTNLLRDESMWRLRFPLFGSQP